MNYYDTYCKVIIKSYKTRYFLHSKSMLASLSTMTLEISFSKNLVFFFLIFCLDIVNSKQQVQKNMLFKRIQVPKYTWSWINATYHQDVHRTEDCGVLCSLTEFNAFTYDPINSICSKGFVIIKVKCSCLIFSLKMNCSHEDMYNETIEAYVDVAVVDSVLSESCCK